MNRDPLGYVDGPNPTAFLLNDPLSQIDEHGLFSIQAFFDKVRNVGKRWFHPLLNRVKHTLDRFQFYNPVSKISQMLEGVGTLLLGSTFFNISGFYKEPAGDGVFGNGEIHDKIRFTYINGILNSQMHLEANLQMISESHGGANVHYSSRGTGGWAGDLFKACLIKCGYISNAARQLATTWKRMIREMGGTSGQGLIIHYAHSLGGTETLAASKLMSEEELKMVRVITFGSASLLKEEGFQDVLNVVDKRDGVCLISDPIAYIKALSGKQKNVVFIGSLIGVPFTAHLFDGYWEWWEGSQTEHLKSALPFLNI